MFANTSIGNTYVNRNMIGAVVGVQPPSAAPVSQGRVPRPAGRTICRGSASERTLTP